MTTAPPELDSLLAVVFAAVDETGRLLAANAGFRRLLNPGAVAPAGTRVEHIFIQPDFASLLRATAGEDGIVHQGLLTMGEYMGHTSSLRARVWHGAGQLRLLAEYDIQDLERLNATVLDLNRDYAQAQVELAQANLKLQRRESQLEQTVGELQATNTRLNETRKKLVESEKMAALGNMVAGIAHEINTPVGVSLAAVSTLQEQTRVLAEAFGKHSMSQSELARYLEAAGKETGLISGGLERIAGLIDAFREVAVGGKPPAMRAFRLKDCIDEVIGSLRSRLPRDAISIRVDCPLDLEIVSLPGDWASVFTNLISNSATHGFKERARGNIRISAAVGEGKLVLRYADDGVGLAEEAKARIFDPFFTTDMQAGMGLGMHLVYNLITHRIGGSIACDTDAGPGAHFTIEVPLRQDQSLPP